MRTDNFMASRKTWLEIRGEQTYRGRWVALDECRYDARTAQPIEGAVVDFDDDLVTLCNRIQTNGSKHCAILFCDEPADSELPPVSRRVSLTPPPGRSMAN